MADTVDKTVKVRFTLEDDLSEPLRRAAKQIGETEKAINNSSKAAKAGEAATKGLSDATNKLGKYFLEAGSGTNILGKGLNGLNNENTQLVNRLKGVSDGLIGVGKGFDGFNTKVFEAEKRVALLERAQAKLNAIHTKISTSVDGMASRFSKASDAMGAASAKWDAVGRAGATVAKTGMALGGAFLASQAAVSNFNKGMSEVAAGTGASGAELGKLRTAALDLKNADMGYGPRDAASAITELGKAGVATSDIVNGGLTGALALAASGAMDVGDASEIAASAMTQFKLSGNDIPHIADLLSAGAAKAQGSVHDLGMGLGQVGLVAKGTGLSIDETVGTLAAFASAGLTGSDAGTSFKSMLQRLTPTSKEAEEQMKILGISAYDAQGKFVGMSALAGNLNAKLSNLTDQQRNYALTVMFGSDAVRAANALYEQGSTGITEWTEKVNDSGHAARTAAELNNNLEGDLKKLKATLEASAVKGDGGMNGALRSLTQTATDFVKKIDAIPSPLLAVSAGFLVVGGGAMALIPKLAAVKAGAETLGITLRGLGTGGLYAAAALAGIKVADLIDGADVGAVSVERLGVSMRSLGGTGSDTSGFVELMKRSTSGLDGFKQRVNTTEEALDYLGKDIAAVSSGFGSFAKNLGPLTSAADQAERIKKVDESLKAMVQSGNGQEAAKVFEKIAKAANENGVSIDDLKAKFPEYNAALESNKNAAKDQAAELEKAKQKAIEAGAANAGLTPELYKAKVEMEESAAAAKAQADAIENATNAIGAYNSILFNAHNTEIAFRDAAAESITKVTENTAKYGQATLDATGFFNLNTAAGREQTKVLDDMAQKSLKHAESMVREGAGTAEITAWMNASREAYIRAAGAAGVSTKAADVMAEKSGVSAAKVQDLVNKVKAIPATAGTNIYANTAPALTAIQNLKNSMAALRDITVTPKVRDDAFASLGKYGLFGADGGVINAYAGGGFYSMAGRENHVAQIAKAGAWRVWAEEETGGEAYIPLAMSKRPRSEEILSVVAKEFGYSLVPNLRTFASGGLYGTSTSATTNNYYPASASSHNVSVDVSSAPANVAVYIGAEQLQGMMEVVADTRISEIVQRAHTIGGLRK